MITVPRPGSVSARSAPRRPAVYVAGGSTEAELVARFMRQLREADIEVTLDWTENIRALRAAGVASDADQTDEQRIHYATIDLAAIRRCDALWYVVPALKSEGGAAESMAAHLLGKHLVVSGPERRRSIFFAFADESYATHEEALASLIHAAVAMHRRAGAP